MTSRRSFLSGSALAAATAVLHSLPAFAAAPATVSLKKRAIPATGELIPVIVMGT